VAPALACGIGSLLAVAYIHVGGSVMDTDVDETR
jgi:hypothetical protein